MLEELNRFLLFMRPAFSRRATYCWFVVVFAGLILRSGDGNIGSVLDLLVEAGIDGINPVEESAGLDVVELMRKYYGRLAFVGGVCNTHVLPSNDKADIKRHVEAIIDSGRNGGLVIGTHSIGPDITPESYDFYRRIVADKGSFVKT